jgi:hypothetical protein
LKNYFDSLCSVCLRQKRQYFLAEYFLVCVRLLRVVL